jgi:hypothetical protein
MADLPKRGAGVRELGLPLPPDESPRLFHRGRMLKRWRYAGVYAKELMLCVGDARIGPIPQRWWAISERGRPLVERTTVGGGGVAFENGVRVAADGVRIELSLAAESSADAVEVASPAGRAWIWTRKTLMPARGVVEVDGRSHELEGEAFIDESAGYHDRVTRWWWSAGFGRSEDGRRVAWNLVEGIHDSPRDSERTLWVDGRPVEVDPVRFAPDLSGIAFSDGAALSFSEEATRRRDDNVLLLRSRYEQPFGTFRGTLTGGLELAEGYGVMESHDAVW